VARELPRGFQHLSRGRVELVVDAELAPHAAGLGLLEEDALERAFAAPAGHGRAPTSVLAVGDTGARLHVRRLVHGGVLGPLLATRFVGFARPLAELDVTQRLRDAGAPVPRPAFALARRALGPLRHLAVATYFEEDTLDASAFLAADPDPARLARAIAAAGRAVRTFHDAGGRHADLHVKNLLLRETGAATACIVVDLDKARAASDATPAERMGELMRLFRSLVKRGFLARVGARGCASFLSAYCADDRRLRAAMHRRLEPEMRKVELHRVGYRARRLRD
jgi:tRNA A-37 threonylcarbamoyl transferase component Bud32